jgi:flagellar motor switch protein FliG
MAMKLRGTHKIAAVLLGVDKDVAAKLMTALPSENLESVSEAMVELSDKHLSPADAEPALSEYARRITGGTLATNDFKELLRQALGEEKAEEHLRRMANSRERGNPFAPIEMLPPSEVADVLLDENEQVCAITLAAMKPTAGARVLECFPVELRTSVLTRIAKSSPPRREVLDQIALSLIARLAPPAPKTRHVAQGVASAAQIMNYLSQETEQSITESMQGTDESLFQSIDVKRVTMDDLCGIDKKAMQKILAGVDTRVLTVALKGASREVESAILDNVSKRSRETILEERDLLGAVPTTEVQQSRMQLLNQVRALMKSGDVKLRRAGNDDVVE